MKVAAFAPLVGVASAIAMPQGKPPGPNMSSTIAGLKNSKGELDGGMRPMVRNELIDSKPCGDVVLIFARASQEPTNMGGSMGPIVCNGLKKHYGDAKVLCQGVGGPYTASIADNVSFRGTSLAAINEATRMFTMANTKCPNSVIVFGGYSQGTAVMHNAVSKLPAALKSKVAAGVLFGDTKNKQDKSQVPNYPKENVQVYCDKNDGVCWGTLSVTNGHFVYTSNGDGPKSVNFLVGKIDAAKGKGAM